MGKIGKKDRVWVAHEVDRRYGHPQCEIMMAGKRREKSRFRQQRGRVTNGESY